MEIQYKSVSEETGYGILLISLSELVHADSRHRYVLQDRMILFCLLNGYINKRQFLILCRKIQVYEGAGNLEGKAADSYARRFFSEKCMKGIFQRKERENGKEGRRDVVYTIGAEGRDRLKQTLPLCGVMFSFEMDDIWKALEHFYPKRKQWREPAHYSHTIGIGDFFAGMVCMEGCFRFEKEISVANGAEKLLGKGSQILCRNLSGTFRADAYAELEQGFLNALKGKIKEKSGYMWFSSKKSIKVLYEQDTGSQRENILSSKLERYGSLFQSFAEQYGKDETLLCLLFSCLGAIYAERGLTKKELYEGKKEAEYILSLRHKEWGSMSGQESEPEGEKDHMPCSKQDMASILGMHMGMPVSGLKSIYGGIQGLSCVLGIKSVCGLLSVLERPGMKGSFGEAAVKNWKVFLMLLEKYGDEDDVNAYEWIVHGNRGGVYGNKEKESGKRYAMYHRRMLDFVKRREIIRRGMEKNASFREAVLQGNMVAAVPGSQMPLLLSFLFPGEKEFMNKLKDYMNFMHFGMLSFHSFQLCRKDDHGVLRNFFLADTFFGMRGIYMENISLDITAPMRLALYLKKYARHPEKYEAGQVLVIFFLSDDLPHAREFALDMELYLPYENGYLNGRFFAPGKHVLEVLFVCIEDMADENRQLPAIVFDRGGCGHYKIFSSSDGPKFLDIPSDKMRVDVPVETSL